MSMPFPKGGDATLFRAIALRAIYKKKYLNTWYLSRSLKVKK